MNGLAPLSVVCVLRAGGGYDAEYVERLKAGVEKHLPAEHLFVCLSDVPVPCHRIPLKHDWPGWFAKMEVFRSPEPVLYFDLDTIICGDLTDIAAQAAQSEFTALRDFYRENGLGSGMMAWNVDMRRLYDQFAADPKGFQAHYGQRGDQVFIEDHVNLPGVARWQDRLPGQVVSWKAHVRKAENIRESGDGSIPPGARVVCFHGLPRPRDTELW